MSVNMTKVVAITGASSGIGAATARHLAARGARLVLGARGVERLETVRDEIAAAGGQAETLRCDVRRLEDMQAMVERARDRFGRLDVLVANAGAMPIGPLADLAVEDWERMVDVNLKGVLWGIAAALPVFRAQGSGHFVTLSSTAARKITPTMAVYAGTKIAVAAIMEGLRQEEIGAIRTTTLYPGFTDTAFASHVARPDLRAALEERGRALAMSPESVAAVIAHAIEQPGDMTIAEIVLRSTAQA